MDVKYAVMRRDHAGSPGWHLGERGVMEFDQLSHAEQVAVCLFDAIEWRQLQVDLWRKDIPSIGFVQLIGKPPYGVGYKSEFTGVHLYYLEEGYERVVCNDEEACSG